MNLSAGNGIRQKVLILAMILGIWFAVIFVRLIQLQVIDHSRLKAEVLEQNRNEIVISPKRGTIYDRNGKILARSLPAESVFFSSLKDEPAGEQIAQIARLRGLLDLSEKEMDRIALRIKKKDSFVWIKRKIDKDKADRLRALNIKGIFLQEESKRFFPQGALAAQVLGGVGVDDNGLAGVEVQYDQLLKGEKGKRLILRDARRKSYSFETLKEARAGRDLHLTIDETIQYIAESEIEKAMESYEASWATVIIADPSSGEILALANRPSYDPNDYPPSTDVQSMNHAVQHTYEPGSTFKIITAAAARELSRISMGETYDCRKGAILVAGRPVRDHKKMGLLTFPEVFIESSNVGAIMIAERIGERNLYQMIKTFRFGDKTGIDLPGEEGGIFRPLNEWRKSSLRIAIGYEISVTPLQVLRAMNVFAARGRLVTPKIALQADAADSLDQPFSADSPIILPEKTVSELVAIFTRVVEEGTGQSARLQGFAVAGKTGTSQKIDPLSGGYTSAHHTASFVGFVPADHPLFSMIVVIDDPKGSMHYGGQVSAPVFRDIAGRVLRYLRAIPMFKQEPIISADLRKAEEP